MAEANEANNLSTPSAAFTIGPDLLVWLDLPGAYAQVAAGSTISITDYTRNDGAAAVAASSTRFYLSADSTLDAADIPLGSRAVPALAAGAISTGPTPLTLPTGIAGLYRIIAVADPDNAHAETNETNNVSVSGTFEIGPDLTIPGASGPAKAGAGATIYVNHVTKNRGAAPAPASTTSIYLSTDALLDASDALLGSRAVPSLAAGIYTEGTTAVLIPANTPAGSYFILVKADAENKVLESNETNNLYAAPIEILPDLRVTIAAPSKAFPGTAITVEDTTINGGAGAGPSTTRFYLSLDSVLDPGDSCWAVGPWALWPREARRPGRPP